MKTIYETRRHLGCELCGGTFYGYYQKTGIAEVPNGNESPHPTKKGWFIVHTHDDVFYPDCQECGCSLTVSDAESAVAIYNQQMDKWKRKEDDTKMTPGLIFCMMTHEAHTPSLTHVTN